MVQNRSTGNQSALGDNPQAFAPWEGVRYAMTDNFEWTRTTDEQLRILWHREPTILMREIGQHFTPPRSEGQIIYRARQLDLPKRARITKPPESDWPKTERSLERFTPQFDDVKLK